MFFGDYFFKNYKSEYIIIKYLLSIDQIVSFFERGVRFYSCVVRFDVTFDKEVYNVF